MGAITADQAALPPLAASQDTAADLRVHTGKQSGLGLSPHRGKGGLRGIQINLTELVKLRQSDNQGLY